MTPDSTKSVLALGELLWDLLPEGPRLGGATANFAVLFARLGASSTLVSSVGADALGDDARRELERLADSTRDEGTGHPRLDLSQLQRDPKHATGTVDVVLNGAGVPQYTIHAPAAWDALELEHQLCARVDSAAAMYFGTLAQRDASSRLTIRALISAAPRDCVRLCDLNLRPPFFTPDTIRWSLRHCDVLKVSDEELPLVAAELGLTLPALHSTTSEAERTAALHRTAQCLFEAAPQCRLLAITLGAHGSYLATRDEEFRHPGCPTAVRDTVGAGDAFTAGLLYGFLHGGSLETISEIANRCGSFVASRSGATPEFPAKLVAELRARLA